MPRNRTVLLIGLLLAGGLLLVYALFLYPQQKAKALKLKEEARTLEALQEAAQQQLAHTRKTIGELLGKGVPVYGRSEKAWGERMPELIQGIDEWVRKANVSLTRLEPEPSEARPLFVVHPFVLEFAGGFREALAFMQGLEQGLRFVPLKWSLEADPKAGRGLKGTCRAVVYEWTGEVLSPSMPDAGGGQAARSGPSFDPFARVRDPSLSAGPRARPSSLVLTGILEFGGTKKAIINGKVQEVGDQVGGRRILSIGEDEVKMEGEARPLRIERFPRVVTPPAGGEKRRKGAE